MADVGRQLISKIIEDDDFVTALAGGLHPRWFEDDEQRRVFRWMLSYFNRYGETPTDNALHAEFPNFKLFKCREPYDYYVDQLRELRRRAIVVDMVLAADDALKQSDVHKAEIEIAKGQMSLGQEVSQLSDRGVLATADERMERYAMLRKGTKRLRGVTTGFPSLDNLTGGFQPEQFILFGGAPKQGKSFVLMRSAVSAQEQGKTVLFLSFEMSQEEQQARYDGLVCGLNARRLLHGPLGPVEYKQLKDGLGFRRSLDLPDMIISTDISATTTASALAAKIDQHRPDVVFVDGVYLMDNEVGAEPLSTQAYTAISRALKRLAQRARLPIVGTTQALSSKMRNGEVTMHSLGWTSAWSQDADLILGVESEPPLIRLRVVGGRTVAPAQIGLNADWECSRLDEVDLTKGEDDGDTDAPDRGDRVSPRDRSDGSKRKGAERSVPFPRRQPSVVLDQLEWRVDLLSVREERPAGTAHRPPRRRGEHHHRDGAGGAPEGGRTPPGRR